MGEANRRGTLEARMAAAQQNPAVLQMLKHGEVPHYAIILDRSEMGKKGLAEMKRGPEELQERFKGAAMQLWEQSSQLFAFVVIWGTWGYSGGLTIPTVDMASLLEQALPKVVERTLEKGGLCGFMPLIEPSLVEAVSGRIAQLQPTTGTSPN